MSKENEKVKKQNDDLEGTIGDLQEQVDAALGAEEMVENLTTKCLDLEDRLAAVIEEKQDLETLHEMDEELQASQFYRSNPSPWPPNILPPFRKSRNASPPSTVTRSLGSFLPMTTRRSVSTKGPS